MNPLKLRNDAKAYPNGAQRVQARAGCHALMRARCRAAVRAGGRVRRQLEDAGATQVAIDVLPAVQRDGFDSGPRLRCVDNGKSMLADELHDALSHGFTNEQGRRGMVRTARAPPRARAATDASSARRRGRRAPP
jgi:hypothetical protein